ncbi:MAG: hypothetical protein JWQ42_1705 [Edaphobacter sp.]|nr:hypothetical protein [Edaphobacter sp.]
MTSRRLTPILSRLGLIELIALIAIKAFFPYLLLAQVPVQIPLIGSIGLPGSAAILGGLTVQMPADANFTLSAQQWANKTLVITSGVSLSATRSIIAPLNKGQEFNIENSTTGGQSIVVIGATGTGVTVTSGTSATVFSDGVNYIQSATGGGGAVASVFGRAGTVTAQTGDYSFDQISGSLSQGKVGTLQAADSTGRFMAATPREVSATLSRAKGQVHFGDSITACSNGCVSPGPGLDSRQVGYALRLQKYLGGPYLNTAVGGTYAFMQNNIIFSTVRPGLNAPLYNWGGGTNDTLAYLGNANLNLIFQRIALANLLYPALPSVVSAQACTQTSGVWTVDNTYGEGNAVSTNGTGNTLTCTVNVPTGSSGTLYACYVINDLMQSSTFTISVDGTPAADPFTGNTTWQGHGDGGGFIGTGQSQAVACARFTGKAVGNHTIAFASAATGTNALMEPVLVAAAPAPASNNPYMFMTGLPLQPPSSPGAPFVATFTGYEKTDVTNLASDGLNVFFMDTQNALLDSVQSITVDQTLSAATFTVPGWLSDMGVSYYPSGPALVKVASAPAVGQYAVAGGIYTFNSADTAKTFTFAASVNCGNGNSTTMLANCYAGDVHPNNFGQAVMFAYWKSQIAAMNFNGQALANGSPQDIANSPASGYPTTLQPPYRWWNPNGLNSGSDTIHIRNGIAWSSDSRNFWGTGFSTMGGITQYVPPGVTGWSICRAKTGQYIPTLLSGYSCPVRFIDTLFETGLSADTINFGFAGSSVSNLFGFYPTFENKFFSKTTIRSYLDATLALNQPSSILALQAAIWIDDGNQRGSGTSEYRFINKNLGNGLSGQSDELQLTHAAVNFCSFTCAFGFRLDTMGYVRMPADVTLANKAICLVDGTNCPTNGAVTVVSGAIGGSPLAAGACSSGTVTVAGAGSTLGKITITSGGGDPGPAIFYKAYVTSPGTIKIDVCAAIAATPQALVYNIGYTP